MLAIFDVFGVSKMVSAICTPRGLIITKVTLLKWIVGSSGGRVVKLLACGARGPGFHSRSRHLSFQRLVISCFQVDIWLKDR